MAKNKGLPQVIVLATTLLTIALLCSGVILFFVGAGFGLDEEGVGGEVANLRMAVVGRLTVRGIFWVEVWKEEVRARWEGRGFVGCGGGDEGVVDVAEIGRADECDVDAAGVGVAVLKAVVADATTGDDELPGPAGLAIDSTFPAPCPT